MSLRRDRAVFHPLVPSI